MFIGRVLGYRRRWFAGGNVSILWLLSYLLIGGFVLYTLIEGKTP